MQNTPITLTLKLDFSMYPIARHPVLRVYHRADNMFVDGTFHLFHNDEMFSSLCVLPMEYENDIKNEIIKFINDHCNEIVQAFYARSEQDFVVEYSPSCNKEVADANDVVQDLPFVVTSHGEYKMFFNDCHKNLHILRVFGE